MISIILILLFVFSVLSVPVCHGVISGLYLYGMKIFPGIYISFILTNILERILKQKNINNPWILVITGLMTGFPNGAYICSWYNKNNPENRLGDMLAGIINIPSPAFLISYVYINILEKCISLPMFLALTYTPVILCSYMAILLFRDKDNKKDNAPHIKNDKKLIFHFFEEAVDSSINTALKLGAYVIIFSVIVNIIMHFSQSNTAGLLISYLFEISNGLAIIKNAGNPMNITVLLTVLLDAFGGVCIIMQTKSICSSYISIKKYIYQKLVLCIVTLAMTYLLIYVLNIL